MRAESRYGKRLNPRRADLHRWRETFAEKLRGRGVDAEATRQPTRGATRNYDPIWRVKAKDAGRLRNLGPSAKTSLAAGAARTEAMKAWTRIAEALATSPDANDRDLAHSIRRFLGESPFGRQVVADRPDVVIVPGAR